MSERRGFTLIEVLIVVFIVAILLSLTLPALRGGVESSRRMSSQSNLHSLNLVVSMYTVDHQNRYPALYPNTLYPRMDDISFGDFWWTVAWNWPGVVYGYLPIDRNVKTYISPDSERIHDESRNRWPTSYWYSTSFVGRPNLWSGNADVEYSMMAAQRVGDVTFASQKVLLWDTEFGSRSHELKRDGPDLAESMPVLFADGSGKDMVPAEATEAVANPFQHRGYDLRLQNTKDGVRGRDVE